MKRPTRKPRVVQRPLRPSELARIRGAQDDDWETPLIEATGNKEWNDDWLAPK